MGFKAEVLVDGTWSQNGEVWPDEDSAEKAGYDLLCRWFVPTDYRVVEVREMPNRPSWEKWVTDHGLPKKHVKL